MTFLLCIRRKLRLPIYPNRTPCTCGHREHDIYGDHAFSCERGSKKRAHNIIAMDFAGALSPALAQAGYLFPNTPMAIEQLFHLRSDSTARPFDISFSPDPTSFHHCPYTTIGADINITGPPPTPNTYQDDAENILNKITANADNNLQRLERGKLGRVCRCRCSQACHILHICTKVCHCRCSQACHILYICTNANTLLWQWSGDGSVFLMWGEEAS